MADKKELSVPELVQQINVLTARLTEVTEAYSIIRNALDTNAHVTLTYSLTFMSGGEQTVLPSPEGADLSQLAHELMVNIANAKASALIDISGRLRVVSEQLDKLLNKDV